MEIYYTLAYYYIKANITMFNQCTFTYLNKSSFRGFLKIHTVCFLDFTC